MRVLVLGAGLMGKEVARDLVKSERVLKVTLADMDMEKAKKICSVLQSAKLEVAFVNAKKEEQLLHIMKRHDIVVNALFYSFNESVAKAAISAGVHCVDLGGHIGHATERVLQLNNEAKAAGVTIIPDLGVAPGAINILSGYGASRLDKVQQIKLYVGGIPLRPKPPLEYNHVFSMEGVLDHYTDPSFIIRDGKKQEIDSLSEVEPVYFDKFGPLEAFHTAGGTSTLAYSYPDLDCLEYKTIRYPGHAEKFQLLVDLNLTRNDYFVEINGQQVRPRDVFLKVLAPIVDLKGGEDVVLLSVLTMGEKKGQTTSYRYEMITYKDQENNVTAMAQATANTISIVAQMIGEGIITKRGVCPPEQIVPGALYIKEMEKRGVLIKEQINHH
ncbi:saccharopine dehydrogenase C-terminal domain-containing protein [Bacillus sp. REN10]|uniref:saccharopine dehydrogenase family protein n=1 Tax=Bacillus sp. REN10 TaxID=2782541 RepID=UPI00193B5B15|nr:saccharopine dehydrogenase C-terminal domain-containing protein [Bacillus sp. REN10]